MRFWAIAALALGGCATLFMEKVPGRWTPATEPRCTETGGWIAWDVLIALGDGIAIPVALAGKTHEEFDESYELSGAQRSNNQSRNIIAITAGVDATLRVLSAIHGNSAQNRCIEARKRRDVYVAAEQTKAPPRSPPERTEIEQLKARLRELEQKPAVQPLPAPAEPAVAAEPASTAIPGDQH